MLHDERPMSIRLRTLVAALGLALLAGTVAAQGDRDAHTLLEKVVQTYQGLARYQFEGTVSVTMSANGQSQSFDVPVLVAAIRPSRVHSEMHNPMMGMQYVSDGTQTILYSEQLNQFVRKPALADSQAMIGGISPLNRYFTLLKNATAWKYLRDEALDVRGSKSPCAVVEVTFARLPNQQGDISPTTLWIDRARHVVLRESTTIVTKTPDGKPAMTMAQTTLFHVTRMNEPVADSFFVFRPPDGAKEVKEFGVQDVDLSGQKAPNFGLRDLQGRLHSLTALRGKVVLLDFWATWCGPCRIEMPRVQRLYTQFRSKGLVVFGISVDDDTSLVRPYIRKNRYTFPILLDIQKQAGSSYQTAHIPTLVIIDRSGTIRSYFVGVHEDSVLRGALATAGLK
jgi:peroxiredoxin/outer membrane lipoprotein-sorting protein